MFGQPIESVANDAHGREGSGGGSRERAYGNRKSTYLIDWHRDWPADCVAGGIDAKGEGPRHRWIAGDTEINWESAYLRGSHHGWPANRKYEREGPGGGSRERDMKTGNQHT